MKVVGLTGGIATGKSLVTSTIRRSGVPVIDCDEIAHAVTKQVLFASDAHLFTSQRTHCTWCEMPLSVLQGKWGYKRVVKAFGTGILAENGEWAQKHQVYQHSDSNAILMTVGLIR